MMYDNGVVVEKNAAIAYAWLLVGKRYGCHDDDQATRNELHERTLTSYSGLSGAEKEEAYRVLESMSLRRGANDHVCPTATQPAVELFIGQDQRPKRTLRLMNHFSLKDSIAFIEELSGARMRPEEVEELRRVLGLDVPKSTLASED